MTETQRGERRESRRRTPAGRHRAAEPIENFSHSFSALGHLAYSGARVSVSITDLSSGKKIVSIDDRMVMSMVSVAKILLLIEISARITARDSTGFGILDKTPGDAIGSSGIWQRLQAPALPVTDLALLVGALGDNLALNVLLRQVGLDAIRTRAESLGLKHAALLDLARSIRGPDDAPQLSVGSTAEVSGLLASLARGEVVDAVTSQRVLGWLSHGADLSLVASAFGLDPLSHRSIDHGVRVINTTGADTGVRCDAGLLRGPRTVVAYAVAVHFDDATLAERMRALEAMRVVGLDLMEYVH